MVVVDRQLDVEPPRIASALVLRLRPAIDFTDEGFFQFCQLNRDVRIELTADSEIVIMPPTGGETGSRNVRLTAQVARWADEDGSGVVFDSSTGFTLPSGAVRSPDVAWVARQRLAGLSAQQKRRFLPLCPDFVIELCSPSDSPAYVQRKMEEYQANGARLGWMIDPDRRQVAIYHTEGRVEWLERPAEIAGDPVLPGFVLALGATWTSPL